MKMRAFSLCAVAALMAGLPLASQAEITLLKQDPKAGDPLSRLDFKVGGSIRAQTQSMTGVGDKSYKRDGYDGGSRFRFTANYYLFDDVSWVGYYELGVNFPAWFGWDGHYADGAHNTTRRQLYTGFTSKTWGTLTFGQQNSVFYDVVGVKTDQWNYDMLAQAPGNGINGDYDGSYRSRKMLKYKNTYGAADVYAAYLFEDTNYLPGKGIRYKRDGGGSLGVDYHITKDLTWGTAWNYTRADVRNRDNSDNKTYNQNIYGTALSWTPGNWTLSGGVGYYQNFLLTKTSQVHNYFADDAWGVEYYAAYKFPLANPVLTYIQPYAMGDRLEYVNGRNYQRIDNGLGVKLGFGYGFSFYYEHVFTSSTDKSLGDVNLLRLRYDF